MSFTFDPFVVFGALVAVSAVMVAEAVYLLFYSSASYRSRINRRLALLSGDANRENVLIQLRRERGMTAGGNLRLPVESLNRLVMQSGLSVGFGKLALFAGLVMVVVFAAFMLTRGNVVEAAGAATLSGFVMPYALLVFLRARRLKKFGLQFPDAIDVIVRSLRAGHPVPIAIAMVAREFKDPVGSEFGIAADEITYGADLETAMRNLYFRVGQDDLPLFVTAVAIQGATGGNLGEILENLSSVIRQRFKMRRKVRALAAEGRMSAGLLSALPIGMFFIINLVSPDFYGSVWQFDLTKFALGCAGAWMIAGNVLMYRMVNFKI